MNYIVDASIVVEYLIVGIHTSRAKKFFSQINAADHLIVPEFCLLECANVIWKQARFNALPPAEAKSLVRVLRMLKLRRAPMKRLLDRTMEIALAHNLAIYDSGYIALALNNGLPLLTIDQQQNRAAEAEGVQVISITDFE